MDFPVYSPLNVQSLALCCRRTESQCFSHLPTVGISLLVTFQPPIDGVAPTPLWCVLLKQREREMTWRTAAATAAADDTHYSCVPNKRASSHRKRVKSLVPSRPSPVSQAPRESRREGTGSRMCLFTALIGRDTRTTGGEGLEGDRRLT